MATKILAIDDEQGILELLTMGLSKEGFTVLTAASGKSGLDLAKTAKPQLVILDKHMPDMDGLDVCRILKESEETRGIPILFLSRKNEIQDKVVGLEVGAEDYIAKPFDFRELVARIRVILRRLEDKTPAKTFQCGSLVVDWERYEVTVDGKAVNLRPKEMEVLRVFLKAGGRVLSRKQIFQQVWGYELSSEVKTRTLDQHISHLRRKLGKEGKRIRSIPQVGYSFEVA